MVSDSAGNRYKVDFDTNQFGFREWGDLSAPSRILIVGDSFTGDPLTSDDKAYFGVIKEELGIAVFAIGGGGYGTLQESLLIGRF